MTKPSKTPRTDAAFEQIRMAKEVAAIIQQARDFARQLERELSDAHAALAETTRLANEESDRHKRELAAERETVANIRPRGMLGPLQKIGRRLRARVADRFFCDVPQEFTCRERQVMMEALRILDTALAEGERHDN